MSLQLAELAIHLPGSIPVFEKYGFNYYLDGEKSFREACLEKGLCHQRVASELEASSPTGHGPSLTLEEMDTGYLIDLINGQRHHRGTCSLDAAGSSLKRALAMTGNGILATRLAGLSSLFRKLKNSLLTHYQKEDKHLFPNLKKLLMIGKDKHLPPLHDRIRSIQTLMNELTQEHLRVLFLLEEIKSLMKQDPEATGETEEVRQLSLQLMAFESGFHFHLHIENNILFPRFKTLFGQMLARYQV
jgi:regulator of cell morphogenesis and NO signaling